MAAGDGTNTSIAFPHLPPFIHDPTNPTSASTWLKQVEIKYKFATNLTDDHKVGLVASVLDSQNFDRVSRALLPEDITTFADWAKFKDVFINLFDTKRSLFADRYNTFQIEWFGPAHESVQEYVSRVRQAVNLFDCSNFSANELSTLVVLMGMKAAALEPLRSLVLNTLIKTPKETLDNITTLLDNALMTERDQKLPEQRNVNFVKKTADRRPQNQRKSAAASKPPPPTPCPACGGAHWKVDCSFKDATCHACGGKGHIAKACKNGKKKNDHPASNKNRRSLKKVGYVKVNTLASLSSPRRHFVAASINGTSIQMQYDSGSDITILSQTDYQRVGCPDLKPAKVQARTANNQALKLDGFFNSSIMCADGLKKLDIYVADVACSLLGLDFCNKIKLLVAQINASSSKAAVEPKPASSSLARSLSSTTVPADVQSYVDDLQKEFAPVFAPGLGRCSKRLIHLQLKPNSHPIHIKARRMNESAKEVMKAELDRLHANGVMKKLENGFSNYATPGSIVKRKDGRSRFVVDYSTGLNDQLQESSYQLPVPEDLFDRFAGCKVFTLMDMPDAYHQIPLDEESQNLTTVSTPFGYFKYLVAAMGLKTLPSDFQQIMDDMLEDLPFAGTYLDDIVVGSETTKQHAEHVKGVLQRIMDWGFRLSLKKCKFFQTSIQFLGRLIDADGIHPDPAKIAAIQSMAIPKDVSTLRSFLGLVNYYQNFVPMMRDLRQPLDDLLKKDASWEWTEVHDNAVSAIKAALTDRCLLTHFDPRLPITVAADASQHGIGGVLSHVFPDGTERPVQFFSRAMNAAQKKYSQTEKEALALITAVKIFHRYLEGRHFTLYTDHKALLSIFGPRSQKPSYALNRLHRWSIFLGGYNFDIKYTNTKEFGQADALSRLISEARQIKDAFEEEEELDESFANQRMVNSIASLPVTAKDIVAAYANDAFAQDVLAQLQDKGKQKSNSNIDRFSVINDVIHMQDRIYIPEVLRSQILEQFHAGHNGVSRTKALARRHCYWPGITVDIEKMVLDCYECIQATNAPTKATLSSWSVSSKPGERVHMDFAGPMHGYMVLIAVDSCSKWIDARPMKHANAYETTKFLFRYCADNGFPKLLVTDNGTQFTSIAFKNFCKENGIQHTTSPVYHPQSNGQAEKMVNIYKRFIKKKAHKADGNFDLDLATSQFLHCYRTTPNTATPGHCTPAKAHLDRELRTKLDLIRPEIAAVLNENAKQNDCFDRHHGAKHRHFKVKDTVFYRLKKDSAWIPAIVKSRIGSRLYRLTNTETGKEIRVHANQLIGRNIGTPTDCSLRFLKSPDDFDYDVIEENTSSTISYSDELDSFHTAAESSSDDAPPPPPPRYPPRARRQTCCRSFLTVLSSA
uniref:RNA-directed DNA polymerase n=1 Tax=Panagrolaimus davidi TaxID=227884 RepID=A0A914Q1Q4_9BILA